MVGTSGHRHWSLGILQSAPNMGATPHNSKDNPAAESVAAHRGRSRLPSLPTCIRPASRPFTTVPPAFSMRCRSISAVCSFVCVRC